jgi:hypothetical protein
MRWLQELTSGFTVSSRKRRSKIGDSTFHGFETFNMMFELGPTRESVLAGDRQERIGLRNSRRRDRGVRRIAEPWMEFPDSSNGIWLPGQLIAPQVLSLVFEVIEVRSWGQTFGRHTNFPSSITPGVAVIRARYMSEAGIATKGADEQSAGGNELVLATNDREFSLRKLGLNELGRDHVLIHLVFPRLVAGGAGHPFHDDEPPSTLLRSSSRTRLLSSVNAVTSMSISPFIEPRFRCQLTRVAAFAAR